MTDHVPSGPFELECMWGPSGRPSGYGMEVSKETDAGRDPHKVESDPSPNQSYPPRCARPLIFDLLLDFDFGLPFAFAFAFACACAFAFGLVGFASGFALGLAVAFGLCLGLGLGFDARTFLGFPPTATFP